MTRMSMHYDRRQGWQRVEPLQPVLDTPLQALVIGQHALEIDVGKGFTECALQRLIASGEGHLPGTDKDIRHALGRFSLVGGLVAGQQQEQRNGAGQCQGGHRRTSADGDILDDDHAANAATVATYGACCLDKIRCRFYGEPVAIVEQ